MTSVTHITDGYTTDAIESACHVKDLYNFDVTLLRSLRTTYSKVCYLTKSGISTQEISHMLNVRYQHVRNEQHRAGLVDQAKRNNIKK